MKKLVILYVGIILLLFPFTFVNAGEMSIGINCPSQAKIGETIRCTVSGNSGTSLISSLEAKIQISSELEFIKFHTDAIWQGNGENGSIDLYTDSNKSGAFSIGVIEAKVKSNAVVGQSILLHNVVYYDHEFNDISVTNASSGIKIVSSNNYLSSLSLDGVTISPSFDKNVTSYIAEVDGENVTVLALAEDQKALVSGTGNKTLVYGQNTIIVKVTSESNEVREYKIVVTRPDNRPPEEEKKEEEKKEENPPSSSSTPSPVVPSLSNDNKLSTLELVGYAIPFQSQVLEYSIEVDANVSTLEVKAVANNNKANVMVSGADKIISGKNEIIIMVTAENGEQLQYVVHVNKNVVASTLLKELSIEKYEIDFKKDIFEYEVKVTEDMLNIQAIPEVEDAIVEIKKNSNLVNGSVVEIFVSYEGNESVYRIKIVKDEVESKTKKDSKKNSFFNNSWN